MKLKSILLYTLEDNTVKIFLELCSDNGIGLHKKSDIASFMVDLKSGDHNLLIYDCTECSKDCLNWVKTIKSLKPKTNLIVISDKIDKKEGGKLYEAGIFHLEEKPITIDVIKKLLVASLSFNDNQLI